jgi:hypothetical protein
MFRTCRMLHGYFSAFAFMALLFFSVTGILLNHPEWFASYEPAEHQASVTLSRAELDRALASQDAGRAIAATVGARTPLHGDFSSADRMGDEMLVRLDGPKGASDLNANLVTGEVRARVTTASLTSILLDLHRGKNSGVAWRWLIDVTGGLILLLSVIGFVLFFSLRFRLRNSLILTAAGLAVLIAVAVVLVS